MYYSFDSRIRYSEVGSDGYLTPESIMNYFQDCSTFQSEDNGGGLAYMHGLRRAWVVSYWQVEILRYPALGEQVTIGTIPYEVRGMFGHRNFYMDTKNGERLAYANSLWTLIDIDKGAPARVSDEIAALYPIHEKLDMEYLPRKIKVPVDVEPQLREKITVGTESIDTNGHVNNEQYIRMAISQLPKDAGEIKRIRAEYKMQAFLGNVIQPYFYVQENEGIYTISLNNEEGKPYCVVELVVQLN